MACRRGRPSPGGDRREIPGEKRAHLRVGRLVEGAIRQRIRAVGIVAGRDRDQSGLEFASERRDDVLDQSEEDLTPGPGPDRHVQRVPLAGAAPLEFGCARSRIERRLVDTGVEHAVGLAEDLLGPVAVVYIPIEDQHSFTALRQRLLGRDRDIVEQAEAHRRRPLGMVTGRTQRADRERHIAGQQSIDRRAGPARRPLRRLPRSSRDRGLYVDHPAAGLRQTLDSVDQLQLVGALELRPRRQWRADSLESRPIGGIQSRLDRPDSIGVLGVRARLVPKR